MYGPLLYVNTNLKLVHTENHSIIASSSLFMSWKNGQFNIFFYLVYAFSTQSEATIDWIFTTFN